MFVGHFGVGLAAKKLAPEINLGFLFFACQLLDLIWPVLVLIGIERVTVDPGATQVTPLDFVHYPYSHSLFMTLVNSLVGMTIGWRLSNSKRAGLVIGATIASHWLLDFVTHRADLPLFFGMNKFGLGLWNSVSGTLIVEIGIFIAGVFLYLQASPRNTRKEKIIFWSLIGFLFVVYLGNVFGPKVPLDTPSAAIAGPALAMWLIVLWAYFCDRNIRA